MTRDASLRRLAWLLPIALATGWWAWQLQEKEAPPPFVGPPRSDYAVDQFELIAFDDAGAESFSLRGPRLARHPELGSFDVEFGGGVSPAGCPTPMAKPGMAAPTVPGSAAMASWSN